VHRLAEAAAQVWRVYDGDTYLGVLTETDPTEAEGWPHYSAQSQGRRTALSRPQMTGVRLSDISSRTPPCNTEKP